MASLDGMAPKKSSLPEGQFIGKIFSLVDFGDQTSKFGVKRQLNVTLELQGTKVSEEDPRPLVTSLLINPESLNEKSTLYKLANSALGSNAEAVILLKTTNNVGAILRKILGKAVVLNLVKNEEGYVNINKDAIGPIGLLANSVTAIENQLVCILDADNIPPEDLAKLNDYAKKKIGERVKSSSSNENSPF